MSRKSRTERLTESIAGQHLALSVAAHLARTQLVPDPLKVYDAQHIGEMLNLVAMALARTSPLYVFDPHSGLARQLSSEELEGAKAQRAATVLALRDGRMLGGVSMRRGDLRQGIAILKAIGLREIAPQFAARPEPAANTDDAQTERRALVARFEELEELLKPPLVGEQVEKAKRAAVFIARHAREGQVANLAMQLMSALHDARGNDDVPGGFRMALARLRAALESTVSGGG
jgi:hypothetical protein